MKKFTYPCGCEFAKDKDNNLIFDPDINKINLNCSRTWDLISSGNTKGCFQLESRLGRMMAKKLRPSSIEELAALISIMRPGCLEAYREGKSVSNHYIDKKNGEESVDYFHDALVPILSGTYGEMIYQEQAMSIAKDIAGFDLQEADMLRKAIGKKKPEEMAKIKKKFLSGSKKQKIVAKEQAEEIFNWIEKSQRYSFNKSHAVSYAMNAYLSAFSKAHFPRIFFSSYLKFAKDKIDPQAEIKELIQNANEMDISVYPPDTRLQNQYFIMKDGKIFFGITDIKGVGESVFQKMKSIIDSSEIDFNNWYDICLVLLLNINSTAAKAMISCGALDFVKKTRTSMLFEYEILSGLTKNEKKFAALHKDQKKLESLLSMVLTEKVTSRRVPIIQDKISSCKKPPYSLDDGVEWMSDTEYALLGYAITCSKIDMYDVSMTNTSCRDFKNGGGPNEVLIAAEIEDINIVKTKKGKNPGEEMAFLTVSDATGFLDSVIAFPEQFNKFKNILYNGSVVVIKGNRSKAKDTLVINKMYLPKS